MIKLHTVYFFWWRKRHRFNLICNQLRGINQVAISATQSVALTPWLKVHFLCLYVLLLVNIFYSWVSMEEKRDYIRFKTSIYVQESNFKLLSICEREMISSWKLFSVLNLIYNSYICMYGRHIYWLHVYMLAIYVC